LDKKPLIRVDGPILIFGGPYSNLAATAGVLAEAKRLGIAREQTICTGDLAAYCGDPAATIDLIRASGIAPPSWAIAMNSWRPEARLWSSLPNREPVAHQNPGAMVSEPT